MSRAPDFHDGVHRTSEDVIRFDDVSVDAAYEILVVFCIHFYWVYVWKDVYICEKTIKHSKQRVCLPCEEYEKHHSFWNLNQMHHNLVSTTI